MMKGFHADKIFLDNWADFKEPKWYKHPVKWMKYMRTLRRIRRGRDAILRSSK